MVVGLLYLGIGLSLIELFLSFGILFEFLGGVVLLLFVEALLSRRQLKIASFLLFFLFEFLLIGVLFGLGVLLSFQSKPLI